MAFTGFTDRVVQYPGRVVMTPIPGEENTYDMSRAEGTVTEEGTPFNAATFNGIADDIIQEADDNIITENDLQTIAQNLGISTATLANILTKLASDALIETGTTDGWSWKKYADGTMMATKSIPTTTTWTTVVAPLANNQTPITKPSNMATVTGGKSVIQQGSAYVVNSIVQLSQGTPILSTHRLSTTAASIAFTVTLEGTWTN